MVNRTKQKGFQTGLTGWTGFLSGESHCGETARHKWRNAPEPSQLKAISGTSAVIEQDVLQQYPVHSVDPVKKIRCAVTIKIYVEPIIGVICG